MTKLHKHKPSGKFGMKIASNSILSNLGLLLYFSCVSTVIADTTLEKALISFKQQQLTIEVEIAADQQQRAIGLMNRTTLATNQGMLFIFNNEEKQSIWMKNTLLPLDVLFLNHKGEIVAMLPDLQPCRQNPCPIYDSQRLATYMLEVNAGFINSHQLKIGQALNLPF